MAIENHTLELLKIFDSMLRDTTTEIEGFSAGIVPLAVHDGKLYVIGAIKDKYYPAAPWQFTFPIGYSENEIPKITATRELMEEIVASIYPNHEMLFAQIKDGKIKAMPLYVGDEHVRKVAVETMKDTTERLKVVGIDIEPREDEYMKIIKFGYLTNTTRPNSKGKQWRDVGYVVMLGNLDSINVIDAEEFNGERLDRQIVAIPVSSLRADNLFKDIGEVGALALYNGEWVPFSSYRNSDEWRQRAARLYNHEDVGENYLPFVPHPLLLKMYDPSFCNLMEKDIPAITRPAEGLDDFMNTLNEHRYSNEQKPTETGNYPISPSPSQ